MGSVYSRGIPKRNPRRQRRLPRIRLSRLTDLMPASSAVRPTCGTNASRSTWNSFGVMITISLTYGARLSVIESFLRDGKISSAETSVEILNNFRSEYCLGIIETEREEYRCVTTPGVALKSRQSQKGSLLGFSAKPFKNVTELSNFNVLRWKKHNHLQQMYIPYSDGKLAPSLQLSDVHLETSQLDPSK